MGVYNGEQTPIQIGREYFIVLVKKKIVEICVKS